MRVDRYAERLQLGCDLQRTASDLDRRNRGGRPELRCSAEDDDFGLVGVELEVVPQEPRPQSSRAAEQLARRSSAGAGLLESMTNKQTDRQTDEQMDSTDALSRPRCGERRLNKQTWLQTFAKVQTQATQNNIPSTVTGAK